MELQMEQILNDFCKELRNALAKGLNACGCAAAAEEIRLLPKYADASWAGPVRLGLDAVCLAEKLRKEREAAFLLAGCCPVAEIGAKNGWILFTLAPEIFDTALKEAPEPPPAQPDDGEDRLFWYMAARQPLLPLPDDAAVRRAVLELFLAAEEGSVQKCRRAADSMRAALNAFPPVQRALQFKRLGGPARFALSIPTPKKEQPT